MMRPAATDLSVEELLQAINTKLDKQNDILEQISTTLISMDGKLSPGKNEKGMALVPDGPSEGVVVIRKPRIKQSYESIRLVSEEPEPIAADTGTLEDRVPLCRITGLPDEDMVWQHQRQQQRHQQQQKNQSISNKWLTQLAAMSVSVRDKLSDRIADLDLDFGDVWNGLKGSETPPALSNEGVTLRKENFAARHHYNLPEKPTVKNTAPVGNPAQETVLAVKDEILKADIVNANETKSGLITVATKPTEIKPVVLFANETEIERVKVDPHQLYSNLNTPSVCDEVEERKKKLLQSVVSANSALLQQQRR